LAITRSEVLETIAFKEKESKKTKTTMNWDEEEKLYKSFEVVIQQIHEKKPPM